MTRYIEEKIQEAIVKRYNELKHYKQLNYDFLLYSNRNENNVGGAKGIRSGARFKRMGRFAGIPDLTLIYKGGFAYVEVKIPSIHRTSKGVETKSKGMGRDQIAFYDNYIEPYDIPFAVASSVEDFEDFIKYLPWF